MADVTDLLDDQYRASISVTVSCANLNVLQVLVARNQANPDPSRQNVVVDQNALTITFNISQIGSILGG